MRKTLMAALLLTGAALALGPATAQSDRQSARGQAALEGRVDRLEGEMRAVQRKVFPGGSGRYVAPESGAEPDDMTSPGTPASSPVTDLTARVNALESQMTGLTGQIETTQHRVQLLEDAFNAYKRTTDARLKALEDGASSVGVGDTPAAAAPATKPAAKPTGTTATAKPPRAATTTADPLRARKVADIERPASDDAAEDQYLYGYRLWEAKYYPEAEAQFTQVVAKYPTHKRASYAQNLLGRAYLDDGKPSLASLAFYDNYKKFPDGDRAPDSLFYLAKALVTLNKPASQICRVYTELSRTYPARIESDAKMKAGIAQGRAESKCS